MKKPCLHSIFFTKLARIDHWGDLNRFRIATVRGKSLKNETFSRSGKSQGISFSVREFKIFTKKLLVNTASETYFWLRNKKIIFLLLKA